MFSGVLPELSAEQVVERLARHGYDGVEWRIDDAYHFRAATIDRDAPRIKALCDAAGLRVAGLTSHLRPDQEDGIRRLIAAAQTLDCPRFRIFSARYDPAAGYWALHADTLEKLHDVERILAGTGVKALLEIHFGTIVCSPSLTYELVRHCDPALIGVILDPANMVIEGSMDLRMGLDILKDYVDLVHVKNVRWELGADRCWRWRYDELKDGACDWAEAIGALNAIGYDGWLSFENFHRVPVTPWAHNARILADASAPARDIDRRLAEELAYMRALVAAA